MKPSVEKLKECPISVSEAGHSHSIVGNYVKPTQILYYEDLSQLIGANVYIKHKNHNSTERLKDVVVRT